MARQGVAWNKEKTKSVVLSKMKEFSISENYFSPSLTPRWVVRGWFNQENSFFFGEFDTQEQAQTFLEQIHAMY